VIIKCPQCDTKFKFDDARLAGGAVKVRCKNCSSVFAVKPRETETQAPEVQARSAIQPEQPKIQQGKSQPRIPQTTKENNEPSHQESNSGNIELSFDEAVNLATEGLLDAPFESEFSLRKKRESGGYKTQSAQDGVFNESGLKPGKESTFKFGSSKVVNAIEGSSDTMALAAEAAITAPRPQEKSQTAINEELYLDDIKKTHELPPQLYKLREIDFDEGDSEIELASDPRKAAAAYAAAVSQEENKNSTTQLQIRELKGIRQENAPKIVSYPRVFTRTVKGVIIFMALLTLLLTVLVALEGDQFNIVQSLSFWNEY